MTFEEYRALDGINWSSLKHMAVSARTYRYESEHRRESATFDMGRAIHCAILEPDAFPLRYAVYTGDRRAGKAWEEFAAANADRDAILKSDEYRNCIEIRDAVRLHPVAGPLLDKGESEVTRQWTDAATGLTCKARLDHVSESGLTDIKSAASVDARVFAAASARYLYHGQLAHYRAATDSVMPVRIIAVEKQPPYEVGVFALPEWVIAEGEFLRKRLLHDLAECMERDEWPGRYEYEQELELPGWAVESEADTGGWDI